MNKILVPKVTFKNVVSDERRIETAYARIFEIARRSILSKRLLTPYMTREYIKVQDGKSIPNNRRSLREAQS
jgi:hypothetical protein